MADHTRQLGQLRPSDTNAASIFTPPSQRPYTCHLIVVTNVGSVDADASIYHDADGSTYDGDTALLNAHTLAPGDVVLFEGHISDYREAGNIAVKSSVADAINFTAYGSLSGERL